MIFYRQLTPDALTDSPTLALALMIDHTRYEAIRIGKTVRVDQLELGALPQHADGADVEITG